jgi:uncharacterized protein (DUF58 family)
MNRFETWLLSRLPQDEEVTLTQKRIYILPTKPGWLFIIVAISILLLGVNYQNNLAYAVAFLMTSLMVTAILHTFANLRGITLAFEEPIPCFANRQTTYRIATHSAGSRDQINVSLTKGLKQVYDFSENSHIDLAYRMRTRGCRPLGVLSLETFYPLGLLRAWSRIVIPHSVLTYPEPLMGGSLNDLSHNAPHADQNAAHEPEDDLDTLKEYQQGESLRRIAWRKAAKGQGLYSLQFEEKDYAVTWLSMALWPELDIETRLSRMTAWVLELEKRGVPYGWYHEGVVVQPSNGDSHKHQILKRLAVYGLPSAEANV